MPLGGLLTVGSLAAAGGGFAKSRERVRARQVAPVDIKDVTARAGEAQGEALQQAISNAQRFGGDFLTSQIGAQQSALPGFFQRRDKALGVGDTLFERLVGGSGLDAFTDRLRSAQAARGVALSPRSAVSEGISTSSFINNNLQQALGLQQRLAGLEAATPFGVEAFRPGIPGLGQLAGLQTGIAQQNQRLDTEAEAFRVKDRQAQNAADAQMFGKLSSALGAAGGMFGGPGGLEGFGQAFGLSPTAKSQVGTTAGQAMGGGSQPGINVTNQMKNTPGFAQLFDFFGA